MWRAAAQLVAEKGNVAAVFGRRIRQKNRDDWPKLQAAMKEEFDRFNQRKEQLRRDYAAFKGETGIAIDFDDSSASAH